MQRFSILFLVPLFFVGCKNEPKEKTTSPEDVTKMWQSHIDNNQFAQAKELSTARMREYIDKLAELVADSTAILKTNFLELTCQIEGDKAKCPCSLKDEQGVFPDTFLLVQENKKWLVDLKDAEAAKKELQEYDQVIEHNDTL